LKTIPEIYWQKFTKLLNKKDLESFKEYSLKPLRKSIRVNTLKTTVGDFKKKAKKLGWILEDIPWCSSGFWIDREDRSIPLGKTYLHQAGHFYIQEASSMLPPELLAPKAGEIVLDMASAPGSKTTQISALMNNDGLILANELEAGRIKALSSNIERLGAANILITKKDGQAISEYFPNFFDRILIDAPCSGEGTIRKDPDALLRWNDKRVETMANLQCRLIEHAFRALKPGGLLVYSTCTLSPEENEDVIYALLDGYENNAELIKLQYPKSKSNESITNPLLEGTLRIWPQLYDSEGFFAALIKKNHPTETGHFKETRRASPFSPLSKKSLVWLNEYFSKIFGIEIKDNDEVLGHLYERGNEIWIRPDNAETVASKIIVERHGVLLAERFTKNMKLSNEGAQYLSTKYKITKGIVDLSSEECQDYLGGKDLHIEHPEGHVLLRYDSVILGLGKSLKTKIKNQLPRQYVIS